LILRLKNEQNKTILLSSHILSEIELIANRMVIINKGMTIVEGDVKELLNQDELIVVFETPQVQQALSILSHIKGIEKLSDNQFQLVLAKNEIAPVNAQLVNNGIEISGIETKRKLEDYFLKLIQS
jgi:ABC-2 type transport system ATP-binding protein